MKTVNILTRTCGRPNFFKIAHHSINSQSYPKIKHWVICDSGEHGYVNDYDNIDEIVNIPPGKYPHFDSYLNEVLEVLPKDELFCMMDDDDFYTTPEAIGEAALTLGNNDVVFYQVRAVGGVVPSAHMMRSGHKHLEFGQLSMLGFLMNTSFVHHASGFLGFPPRYGGDFHFIDNVIKKQYPKQLYNHPRLKWIPKLFASTNPGRRWGKGEAQDISYKAAWSGYCQASSCPK